MTHGRAMSLGLLLVSACAGAGQTPEAPPSHSTRPAVSLPELSATVPRGSTESAYVSALRHELGDDAVLSLEPALQEATESALLAEHTAGAVVALDPNDGRIVALFSVPGDRGDPLLTAHQPDSTFKSFTALAALESKVITPSTVLTCTGRYAFSGRELICPSAHGDEDVRRALAVSCNSFFYEMGHRLDPERLAGVARTFGLDARTGIELDDRPGVVPAAADAEHPVRPLLDAIGHGAYEVTLLELSRAYAAIGNGGRLPALHVVDGRRRADGTLVPAPRSSPRELSLAPDALALVQGALTDAVAADYGRAHAFAIDGFPFAGKTGGSDSPPRPGEPESAGESAEHDSWFVGYAPPAHPTLLVGARLERARGTRAAGNVVAAVFERARQR